MPHVLKRAPNAFSRLSTRRRCLKTLTCSYVTLLVLLTRMSPTASEQEVDCRNVSGYSHGPVPDTCTAQLTLNDTDNEVISSLKAKYRDFPLRCRLRKYKSYVLINPRVVQRNHSERYHKMKDFVVERFLLSFIPLLLSTGV